MGHMTARRPVERMSASGDTHQVDDVIVESPLALVLRDVVLATIMRTPGHDLELAAGWLVAEAGVRHPTDITTMGAFSADPGSAGETDTVRIALAEHIGAPHPRAHLTSSSCGVCSSRVMNDVPAPSAPLRSAEWSTSLERLLEAPEQMRAHQRAFDKTGGVHAATLIAADGTHIVTREDVGRHNAVDKVMGYALTQGLVPLTDNLLVVSGRVSFEIVQKALAGCVAGIVAVSAPSTLAIDLAKRHGLLLAGLIRDARVNVYAGAEAIS
jgi:FdhD protein